MVATEAIYLVRDSAQHTRLYVVTVVHLLGALGSIVLTTYDWRYCRAVVGSARVSGVCPPATRRQRQCAFANSPAPWRSAHQQRALGVFICSEGSRSLYCGDAPAAVTMVCRNPLCERRSVRLSPICPRLW